MSFVFAGAMMGLGQGLSEWGKYKREQVAAEKKREADMADAKELVDYKADAQIRVAAGKKALRGSGTRSTKGSNAVLSTTEEGEVAAFVGYDREVHTDRNNPEHARFIKLYEDGLALATQAKRQAIAQGRKPARWEYGKLLRDYAQYDDKVETDYGWPGKWDNEEVVTPGAGPLSGFGQAVQTNTGSGGEAIRPEVVKIMRAAEEAGKDEQATKAAVAKQYGVNPDLYSFGM